MHDSSIYLTNCVWNIDSIGSITWWMPGSANNELRIYVFHHQTWSVTRHFWWNGLPKNLHSNRISSVLTQDWTSNKCNPPDTLRKYWAPVNPSIPHTRTRWNMNCQWFAKTDVFKMQKTYRNTLVSWICWLD